MNSNKKLLFDALSPPLPQDVAEQLIDDYLEIKSNYFLRHFRPSELSGGRFTESVLRIIELEDQKNFTPLGTSLNTEKIINRAKGNKSLNDSIRFFIPQLSRVLLDIRNRRDVAHVAKNISPNIADSLFICQCADWIMVELIRVYSSISIQSAKKIISRINEIKIPTIVEVDGFVRIQNTNLSPEDKVLLLLYYKFPEKVSESNLRNWSEYKNSTRFKNDKLNPLHKKALIHFSSGECTLLPKGRIYVEANIPMDLLL